jgi:hypothetical protein
MHYKNSLRYFVLEKSDLFQFLFYFSNTNILYCFHGTFELTSYVSHKIRLSL